MRGRQYVAHAITALRVVLTPLFVVTVWRAAAGGPAWPAVAIFAAVVLSDLADGRAARALGAESARGRALDHAADVAFLLAALATYVLLGGAPWWVPAAIAAAFAVYVGDSLSRREPAPRLIGSRIGHVGGVLNYVLVGMLVCEHTLALRCVPSPLWCVLFSAVPIYSALSIATRLSARRRGARPARG